MRIGAFKVAEKMIRRGDCVDDIVEMTELPKEKVKGNNV